MRAIIGGAAGTSMGYLKDSSTMSLQCDALFGAIEDAGLDPAEVDGLLAAYSIVEPQIMMADALIEYSGLRPSVAMTIVNGGVTAAMMVMQAAMLIEQGYCRHVAVVAGDNRLSGLQRNAGATIASLGAQKQWELPHGLTVPAAYALIANRYMHEYGVDESQLAAIPVTQRRHASLHPRAHKRTPISIEDVLQSRMIATPLRLLDCCPNSDGAGALIISSADTARDMRHPAIEILGAGQGHSHEFVSAAPSLLDFACKQSSATAFERSGLAPKDMDFAQIYDSFTITLAVGLESCGIYQRGEAGPAAARGELGLGGRFPCNTHGGLLSYGHSGAAGGLFHFIEAVEQLRGDCGERQVEGASLGFVHGDGGILGAHCSVILGRA